MCFFYPPYALSCPYLPQEPSLPRHHVEHHLTAYAMAHRALYGKPEKGVRLDVMVKTRQPKIQQLEGVRTEADIQRFLRLVGNVERGIRSEVSYPNQGFMCAICGYREPCDLW